MCDAGWTGSNCNVQTCIAACVNGYCNNATRLCDCNAGFTGKKMVKSPHNSVEVILANCLHAQQYNNVHVSYFFYVMELCEMEVICQNDPSLNLLNSDY